MTSPRNTSVLQTPTSATSSSSSEKLSPSSAAALLRQLALDSPTRRSRVIVASSSPSSATSSPSAASTIGPHMFPLFSLPPPAKAEGDPSSSSSKQKNDSSTPKAATISTRLPPWDQHWSSRRSSDIGKSSTPVGEQRNIENPARRASLPSQQRF